MTRLPDDAKLRFATLLEASHWAIDSDEADEGLTYAKQAFDVDPKAAGAAEAKYYMGIARGSTATGRSPNRRSKIA